MRYIFSHPWGSFVHFMLGLLASKVGDLGWLIMALFIGYEVLHNGIELDSDSYVCISEFFCGDLLGYYMFQK